MGKQSWKPGNMLNPVPAVMVSCADREGKPNIITIAWAGTVCTNPPMVSISVRPTRYSYDMIRETGEFVINLVTEPLTRACDYCGVVSGRDVDKFAKTGLTPIPVEGVSVPLLWKTGTSNGFRDAWTAGYAGRYIIVVWLGNFNGRPDPWLQGALVAQPVFRSAAVRLLTDREFAMSAQDVKRFDEQPAGVRSEPVCRSTGDLATDAQGRVRCTDTVGAWFIPGVSPIRDTGFLKEILVDEATGLRACEEGDGVRRVFVESWPSEYQQRFLEAGIVKTPIPDWKPECRPEGAVSGTPPAILSPRAGTRYYTGTAGPKQAGIVLRASLAPDAKIVYWFADDRFIGASGAGGSVVWQPEPGSHRVSAVDDLGRRSHRTVTVRQP